jgi:hypothetical protein
MISSVDLSADPIVIPAQAGIQGYRFVAGRWTPAFAG